MYFFLGRHLCQIDLFYISVDAGWPNRCRQKHARQNAHQLRGEDESGPHPGRPRLWTGKHGHQIDLFIQLHSRRHEGMVFGAGT